MVPARADNVTDPALAARLLTARGGQTSYTRLLHVLSDDDFAAPSPALRMRPAHLIAHVGLTQRDTRLR